MSTASACAEVCLHRLSRHHFILHWPESPGCGCDRDVTKTLNLRLSWQSPYDRHYSSWTEATSVETAQFDSTAAYTRSLCTHSSPNLHRLTQTRLRHQPRIDSTPPPHSASGHAPFVTAHGVHSSGPQSACCGCKAVKNFYSSDLPQRCCLTTGEDNAFRGPRTIAFAGLRHILGPCFCLSGHATSFLAVLMHLSAEPLVNPESFRSCLRFDVRRVSSSPDHVDFLGAGCPFDRQAGWAWACNQTRRNARRRVGSCTQGAAEACRGQRAASLPTACTWQVWLHDKSYAFH